MDDVTDALFFLQSMVHAHFSFHSHIQMFYPCPPPQPSNTVKLPFQLQILSVCFNSQAVPDRQCQQHEEDSDVRKAPIKCQVVAFKFKRGKHLCAIPRCAKQILGICKWRVTPVCTEHSHTQHNQTHHCCLLLSPHLQTYATLMCPPSLTALSRSHPSAVTYESVC